MYKKDTFPLNINESFRHNQEHSLNNQEDSLYVNFKERFSACFTTLLKARNYLHISEICQILLVFLKSEKMLQ